MKALALIEEARFGSETMKAIGEAFDQGSARIKVFSAMTLMRLRPRE